MKLRGAADADKLMSAPISVTVRKLLAAWPGHGKQRRALASSCVELRRRRWPCAGPSINIGRKLQIGYGENL
jgi:hypothetical protein